MYLLALKYEQYAKSYPQNSSALFTISTYPYHDSTISIMNSIISIMNLLKHMTATPTGAFSP